MYYNIIEKNKKYISFVLFLKFIYFFFIIQGVFTNPNEYAKKIKTMYPHIQKVWVYSNAIELRDYLRKYPNAKLDYLDGISCSIKVPADIAAFNELLNDERITNLHDNLCYVFENLVDTNNHFGNFRMIDRKWQVEFIPADNSIFRRL